MPLRCVHAQEHTMTLAHVHTHMPLVGRTHGLVGAHAGAAGRGAFREGSDARPLLNAGVAQDIVSGTPTQRQPRRWRRPRWQLCERGGPRRQRRHVSQRRRGGVQQQQPPHATNNSCRPSARRQRVCKDAGHSRAGGCAITVSDARETENRDYLRHCSCCCT